MLPPGLGLSETQMEELDHAIKRMFENDAFQGGINGHVTSSAL